MPLFNAPTPTTEVLPQLLAVADKLVDAWQELLERCKSLNYESNLRADDCQQNLVETYLQIERFLQSARCPWGTLQGVVEPDDGMDFDLTWYAEQLEDESNRNLLLSYALRSNQFRICDDPALKAIRVVKSSTNNDELHKLFVRFAHNLEAYTNRLEFATHRCCDSRHEFLCEQFPYTPHLNAVEKRTNDFEREVARRMVFEAGPKNSLIPISTLAAHFIGQAEWRKPAQKLRSRLTGSLGVEIEVFSESEMGMTWLYSLPDNLRLQGDPMSTWTRSPIVPRQFSRHVPGTEDLLAVSESVDRLIETVRLVRSEITTDNKKESKDLNRRRNRLFARAQDHSDTSVNCAGRPTDPLYDAMDNSIRAELNLRTTDKVGAKQINDALDRWRKGLTPVERSEVVDLSPSQAAKRMNTRAERAAKSVK